MKELTIDSWEDDGTIRVLFEMEDAASEEVGVYFRDLSLNYSDYSSGKMPWPTRPAGLKSVNKIKTKQGECN